MLEPVEYQSSSCIERRTTRATILYKLYQTEFGNRSGRVHYPGYFSHAEEVRWVRVRM